MISIAIQVGDDVKLPVPKPQIHRWARSALKSADITECQLSFIFLDASAAKALNKQFRKKNYATNVLTFTIAQGLADVVICLDVVKTEAKEQRKSQANHLAHMVIHGTLHAVGHDHEKAAEASLMESLETQILRRFGIACPY
jgi:probable rRNA maturation factor